MAIDWDVVQGVISPMKNYEELCKRLRISYGYPFVRENFNFSQQKLLNYTQDLLGGDARQRYTDYLSILEKIIHRVEDAGTRTLLQLHEQTASRELLEKFVKQSRVPAKEVGFLLKFIVYWLIPNEKYMSGLVRNDEDAVKAIKVLQEAGIRTNLEVLQAGITPEGRKSLAKSTGLPAEIITELVNRADFSRLPWASKATISNIMGAGYGSLEELANADANKLYEDFFRYGKRIGKNLKLGNEIENSYRIARIVPRLVEE